MDAIEVSWLWLLPACPALGALFNATVGRWGRRERPISAVAIAAVSAAFGVGLFALAASPGPGGVLTQQLWTVIDTGPVRVDAALAADPLAILAGLVISGLGTALHVFSIRTVARDPGAWRYFATLNLSIAALLVVVLADNLVLMFAGWGGVGLASWVLTGFRYERSEAGRAATRALVVNRLGDAALLIGILLLCWSAAQSAGSALTFELRALAQQVAANGPAPGWVTAAALLIFAGLAAKSAQLPLQRSGPRPVFALHLLTIGAGGGYLLLRLWFLYSRSAAALEVVACVGVVTAIYAASRRWADGPPAPRPVALASVAGRWGFELLYQRAPRAITAGAASLAAFDRIAIDGLVEAVAAIARYLCLFAAALDYYLVDGLVALVAQVPIRAGRAVHRLQNGDLARYLYVAVAGALILLGLQYWLR